MDHFAIGLIHANGLRNSATLGIGPSLIVGAHSVGKTNTAAHAIAGDRAFVPTVAGALLDDDLCDTPTWRFMPPPWLEAKEG